jgi:hypothetical protein
MRDRLTIGDMRERKRNSLDLQRESNNVKRDQERESGNNATHRPITEKINVELGQKEAGGKGLGDDGDPDCPVAIWCVRRRKRARICLYKEMAQAITNYNPQAAFFVVLQARKQLRA